MSANQSKDSIKNFHWPFLVMAAATGLISSWAILSGDDLGRVNLQFMLLLYFFLPIVTLILSFWSLLTRRHRSVAFWLSRLDIFPLHKFKFFRDLRHAGVDSLWLLQQSQLIAMVFSVASLLVLLVLLTLTDVSFIWRSTLLQADDLYPLLNWMASPWSFWPDAQPTIQMLRASHDFRLLDASANPATAMAWWPFVIAVQIFYGLLPRLLMYLVLSLRLSWRWASISTEAPLEPIAQTVKPTSTQDAGRQFLTDIDSEHPLYCWDAIPDSIVEQLVSGYRAFNPSTVNDWQKTRQILESLQTDQSLIVAVKAWEPPMAELSDALKGNSGLLLPLNWQGDVLRPMKAVYQEEWQRFADTIGWRLLLTETDSNG